MPIDVYGYNVYRGSLVCYVTDAGSINIAICVDLNQDKYIPFDPDGSLENEIIITSDKVFLITDESLPSECLQAYVDWYNEYA